MPSGSLQQATADDLQREAAFIGALDAGQQYLDHLEQLSQELKTGFFSLSQAKYSAGHGKIGQLQYPASMRASLRAPRQRLEEAEPERVCTSDFAESSGHREQDPSQQAGQDPGSRQLDNRSGYQGVLGELAQQFGCLTAGSEGDSIEASEVKDPLSWFGVMLPASLRDAQKHFQSAVQISLMLSKDRAQLLADTAAYNAPAPQSNRTAAESTA